jgi:hypothetical protein
MDFYMYRLNCTGWLGNYSDIKHIVVSRNTDESRVVSQAKKISEDANGGGACDIQLLQKYHMMIEPKKSYPALTGLTFHGSSISAVSINKNEKGSFLDNQ